MNAHNERFNRTIQEQFINYHEDLLFTDLDAFNKKLAQWLIDYNTKIPHYSLNLILGTIPS
ncbi:integrase core domain-containing protein [Nitratiruptor tergarcus]|uniref:integrase core domain-containing protein n=1 Tax=Nitratiruptor tergarcus TaxID=269259 RepID=UPI0009FC86A0|nr:integrase core domain-containing protein [Nitratiruptor tergarcus]